MIVDGKNYPSLGVFRNMMTVPDCIVVSSNKIGHGHGEAKLYISSKKEMYEFYGHERFQAHCFMLRKDLIAYMNAIRKEYLDPSQNYGKKEMLPDLWSERMKMIQRLDEIITFSIYDQYQISGPRGYINSNDDGYQIIRQIALPLVSYIYVEKIGTEKDPLYYWKLFVDFDAIWEKKSIPLVFQYGKRASEIKAKETPNQKEIGRAREGQGKYREGLLQQCHFCPITKISDERLLIASHIKPWAASDDQEKIDPYNGFILSPMYDKLFDKGFITFTEKKHVILSDFISSYTWRLIGLKNDSFIEALPMDQRRIKYLQFHHESVFKGSYDDMSSTR